MGAAAVGDDDSEGPSQSCDFIWGLVELMTAYEAKVTLARRWGGGAAITCSPHINVTASVNPTDRSTEFKEALTEGHVRCLTR